MPSNLYVTDGSVDDAAATGTLRWAVANANNGDTIIIKGNAQATGITLQTQLVLSQQDLTIETNGQSQATITQTGADRIFSVSPGAQVDLSNLTLTGGNSVLDGGGIYNDGTLALNSCNVSADTTLGSGGGVFNAGDGTLTLTDCTLSHDASSTGCGLWNSGTTTIDHCRLTNNGFAGQGSSQGSGLWNTGTLRVSSSTVSDNVGGFGAGIVNQGTATLIDSKLYHNVSDIWGGGIVNEYGATLTVTGSTLSDNLSVNGSGGGIFNAGTATVTDSKLSDNSAGYYGGGIDNFFDGTLTMSGCTLSANSAGESGGAIFNEGAATLNNCTLSNNSAFDGGGIYNGYEGTMTVSDCTLSGNTAYAGGGIFNDDSFGAALLTLGGSTFCNNSPDAIFGPYSDDGGNTFC